MVHFLDNFIKKELKEKTFIYYKSRAMVGIHLFLIVFAFGLMVVDFFLGSGLFLHLLLCVVVMIAFLLVFKYFGNFDISSNTLCALSFVFLSYTAFSTGGLFSDNCYWLLCTPIIALLFGSKRASFLWLGLNVVFVFYLYYNDVYPREYTKIFLNSTSYYFIGYLFLYATVFTITYIFKTEQYYIVQSLQNQNELLEQKNLEIEEMNLSYKETQQKLKLSNAELEQFAYVASHDLKEPLRMISMYTQMIKRKLKTHLDADTEEFMFYVTDGTKRMSALLEDLLDYSRLGKKDNKITIDLNDVMLVIQQNLKVSIQNNQAEITFDSMPKINAVFSEIVQLFQNLVNNAIKFRKPAESPIIKIGIKSIDNQSFTVMIKDNGIGMESSMTPRIFNLFERLHSRDQYEGTGIGLATCKKVMEHLGGEITVDSEPNVGSTFYLKFPNSILVP